MTRSLRNIVQCLSVGLGLALCTQSATAQSDRVVALVVSVGEGTARADEVQNHLQALGAETLRSVDPNNAEMRSMLLRFADESEDARATFVYLDMPAVIFADREYVLPDSTDLISYGTGLDRPTDLFTKSIPLLAFARTAALAEQGGAVIMTVTAPVDGVPDGLTEVTNAPEGIPGASTILVVNDADADPVLLTIAAAGADDDIEVGAMLQRMAVHEGVSLSALPSFPIFLKIAPQEERIASPVSAVEPEEPASLPEPEEQGEQQDIVESVELLETPEELAILEQSLSRSAKRAIQSRLRDLDHYKGLVDGIFGPQTREAITAFQTTRAEDATGLLTRRQLLDLRTPE